MFSHYFFKGLNWWSSSFSCCFSWLIHIVRCGFTWNEPLRVKYFIWENVNSRWQGTPRECWIINNFSSLLASCIYAYWISCCVSPESVCLCERKQDTTEPTSVWLQRVSCCAIQTIKSPQPHSLGELPGNVTFSSA